LKKAREEDPTSTLAAYYLGLAYKQAQDYREAVKNLNDAVTYRPKIKGALIELIDCLYQLDRLNEAEKWISEAEAEGIRPAQVKFLKGLILLKGDRLDEAIAAFRNAEDLDGSMKQACDYQMGVAHLKGKRFRDAKEAFREVIIVSPGSNIANYANEYVDAISKREEAMKPLKINLGFAWQYDDNVVLQPTDSALVSNVSDKGDSRQVWTGSAEYDHRFNEALGLKGSYSFYYGKQNDLGFYDMVTNNFIIQPSMYFANGLLTFPSGYSHTIVNDKAYLSSPLATGIYNFMVGKSNMGQVNVKYQYRDYLWDPSTNDEDRTGNDLGGGFGWYYFFASGKGFLNLRYGLNREWTFGNNWEYAGNRITGAALVPIIDRLNLTVSGDVYLQDFANSNSIFHVYRKDRIYTLSALAAYKFYKDSEIQMQYTFIKDSSNISLYDYNRNIYSVGVNIKF